MEENSVDRLLQEITGNTRGINPNRRSMAMSVRGIGFGNRTLQEVMNDQMNQFFASMGPSFADSVSDNTSRIGGRGGGTAGVRGGISAESSTLRGRGGGITDGTSSRGLGGTSTSRQASRTRPSFWDDVAEDISVTEDISSPNDFGTGRISHGINDINSGRGTKRGGITAVSTPSRGCDGGIADITTSRGRGVIGVNNATHRGRGRFNTVSTQILLNDIKAEQLPMARDSPRLSGQRQPGRCYHCQEAGHMAKDCPLASGSTEPQLKCHNCGQFGHITRECKENLKCRNCGEGHITQECKENMRCFTCHSTDYRSFECPNCVPNGLPQTALQLGYMPEFRDVADIYLEDHFVSKEYETVVEGDEDITVTPSNPEIGPMMEWKDSGFDDHLLRNIQRAQYKWPRKIQRHSIPLITKGYDVMGHAETGSGKTAAFLLPIVNYCIKEKAKKDKETCNIVTNRGVYPEPYAIVILPTRELCNQIYEQAKKFSDGIDLQVCLAFGGTSYREIVNLMYKKGCDILCCTPGRVRTMLRESDFGLGNFQFLVLDEADRLLETRGPDVKETFMHLMEQILNMPKFPPKDERTSLMFSATYPDKVQRLARNIVLNTEKMVLVSNGKWEVPNHRIKQEILRVYMQEKFDKVLEILTSKSKSEEMLEEYLGARPNTEPQPKVLIFVGSTRRTEQLAIYLENKGIENVEIINGQLSQGGREKALNNFRSNKSSILISTDVFSRGLDFKDLNKVINCDLPRDIHLFIHRVGRTGRLRAGHAISFFDPTDPRDKNLAKDLDCMLKTAGLDVPKFLEDAAVSSRFERPEIDLTSNNNMPIGTLKLPVSGRSLETKKAGNIYDDWASLL